MPIPFSVKKPIASLILAKRKAEGGEVEESQENYSLSDCAKDLIIAVHAHDVEGVASALEEAFQKLEEQPHKEGPHTYEAQNRKAAQGE